jgi:hypothetical protein
VVSKQNNLCQKTLLDTVLTWVSKKPKKFLVAHELFGHRTLDMLNEAQEQDRRVVGNLQV